MSDPSQLIADVREYALYMKELGVERVDVTLPPAEIADPLPLRASATPPIQDGESPERYVPAEIPSIVKSQSPQQQRQAGSRINALPSLARRKAAPIRDTPLKMVPSPPVKEPYIAEEMKPVLPETIDSIESIRAEIGDCTRCPLHTMGRKQVVHSTGNFNADLMFVGEAPGADEDEQGFPFVGRAGQLLTKIIESIGMKREEVFIGNINRCRPPGNRQPVPEETAACRPFLLREIQVVKPKVIVVLGATAAQNLLQTKTPISKLRGNFQEYFGVKVMPTFHPAYLLRDPHKKREVWEDMKKVRDYLNSN